MLGIHTSHGGVAFARHKMFGEIGEEEVQSGEGPSPYSAHRTHPLVWSEGLQTGLEVKNLCKDRNLSIAQHRKKV